MAHRDLLRENAWVFENPPGPEQIEPLLKEVPAWHGSQKMMDEYMGYVVSISQKIGRGDNEKIVWRLYTTVAGKIAILHDSHLNDAGDLTPWVENVTIEYKNGMVVVSGMMNSPVFGSRFEVGSGVIGDGARGADRTNPVENAMTSWRGRAASALCGAGVLPYTGIASAEEVRTANSREEMAEHGYRVVTPDTARQEPTKQTDSGGAGTDAVIRAFQALSRNNRWDDVVAKAKLETYLQSIGETVEGDALEYMANMDGDRMGVLNGFIKWSKDNNG